MFAFVLGRSESARKIAERIFASFDPFGRQHVTFDEAGNGFIISGRLAATVREPSSPRYFECPDNGTITLFDGWLDNRAAMIDQLAMPAGASDAQIYQTAIRRWGDLADLKIVGHYASLTSKPDGLIRLARSPIGARPLHWAWIGEVLVVASVPKLLSAAGLPARLDERTLADAMYLNLTDNRGWLRNSWRLGVGEFVELPKEAGHSIPKRYWDPHQIAVQPCDDDRAIEKAEILLGEAISACLTGTEKPGILLSGGLDSANVASRVAQRCDAGNTLPTFTFVPLKGGVEKAPHWGYVDETSLVEEFADLHPAIAPRFVANEDRNFESDWDKVFSAIGCAPPGLTNIWMYHGLYAAARAEGCDRLLTAEYGNQSFSIAADWAIAEFFRKGKWREAWRQVSANPVAIAPKWRRFLRSGVAANLPDRLWRLWQKAKRHRPINASEEISAINRETARKHDVAARSKHAGLGGERSFLATRGQWVTDVFSRGDMGSGEIELAFEQIYGISTRDPTAYRPLVEHCLALPTEVFARDGEDRWLARQMSRGHLPDAQRINRKAGMHQADWHRRMTPELPRIRAELVAASQREDLQSLFDFEDLLQRLDEWPEEPGFDDLTTFRFMMGIPIALMTARFVRHTYGWNE